MDRGSKGLRPERNWCRSNTCRPDPTYITALRTGRRNETLNKDQSLPKQAPRFLRADTILYRNTRDVMTPAFGKPFLVSCPHALANAVVKLDWYRGRTHRPNRNFSKAFRIKCKHEQFQTFTYCTSIYLRRCNAFVEHIHNRDSPRQPEETPSSAQ